MIEQYCFQVFENWKGQLKAPSCHLCHLLTTSFPGLVKNAVHPKNLLIRRKIEEHLLFSCFFFVKRAKRSGFGRRRAIWPREFLLSDNRSWKLHCWTSRPFVSVCLTGHRSSSPWGLPQELPLTPGEKD